MIDEVAELDGQDDLYSEIHRKYEVVLAESASRLTEYRRRRRHYQNTDGVVPGSAEVELSSGRRHQLRIPRAHLSAVGLVGKLVGNLPQIHVIPRSESEAERWRAEAIEKILAGTYSDSRAGQQFHSAAWHGTVLGAGCWRLRWNFKRNMPEFYSIKPDNLLVKLGSADGRAWDYAIYVTERSISSLAKQYKKPSTYFTADREESGTGVAYVRVYDFWNEGRHIIAAGGRILHDNINPFGFIPYVVVRNVGPNEYVWGLSDQEFFESLSEYYNALISSHADVIRMYANAPVFARRTGLTANQIRAIFQEGGVISTNRENAEVSVITASGAPPEFQNQDQRIRELLNEATYSTPQNSDYLSGSALAELSSAQQALTLLKRANWEAAMKTLNEYLLRMVERLGSGPMEFSGIHESGVRSYSFHLTLDSNFEMPDAEDVVGEARMSHPQMAMMEREEILQQMMPKELNYRTLIGKHYETSVVWTNRSQREDPQYQLALLNRFVQGGLSLRSYLELSGCEDVDREIRRLEEDNRERPWLRAGGAMAGAHDQQAVQGGGVPTPPERQLEDRNMANPFAGQLGGGVPGLPYGG